MGESINPYQLLKPEISSEIDTTELLARADTLSGIILSLPTPRILLLNHAGIQGFRYGNMEIVRGIHDSQKPWFHARIYKNNKEGEGFDNDLIAFASKFKLPETYNELLSLFSPQPRYYLSTTRHTDHETAEAALKAVKKWQPSFRYRLLTTEYLIGNDQNGKAVILPTEVKDRRYPLYTTTKDAKPIVSETKGGDLELLFDTLNFLTEQLPGGDN